MGLGKGEGEVLPLSPRDCSQAVPGVLIVGREGQAAREGKILRVLTDAGIGVKEQGDP